MFKCCALLLVFALGFMPGMSDQAWADDTDDVVAAVEAYHHALAAQDSAAACNLLAGEVVVLESGYAETLEEYLGHHLGADMEFASQTSSQRTVLQTTVMEDVAWVSSTSETEGTFREQEIRSAGVELMVLSKTKGEWKIRAIHWSSRRIKASE